LAQRPVGKASIKVEVDGIDQAKQKLDDVKSSAEGVGDSGRRGFGALDDAVGKAGQKIEDSTAGLRKFQGAITGIIGVVTGLGAVAALAFGSIIEKVRESRQETEELNNLLDKTGKKLRDSAKEYVQSSKEISEEDKIRQEAAQRIVELSKQTNAAQEELADYVLKRTTGFQLMIRGQQGERDLQRKIAEESKKLNEDLASSVEKIVEDRDNRLSELADKRAEEELDKTKKSADERARIEGELQDQLQSLQNSRLDEEDRLLAEYQQRREEREKQYNEAVESGFSRQAELLDQIDKIDAQNTNDAIRRIEERRKAEEDAAKASADAESKRQENESQRELAIAMQELRKAIEDQARSINQNNAKLERLNQQVSNFTPSAKRIAEGTTRRKRAF